MPYTDPKFQVNVPGILSPPTSWGTATVSGAIATTGIVVLPKFFKAEKFTSINARCTVIPNAASTALVANFLNGTNTFATITLTTATAGQVVSGVVTESNATFAAAGQPTVNLNGTATASAAAQGSWEIFAETKEAYS
jgi:hypothetical protein